MHKIRRYYLEHTLTDFHVSLVALSFALWLTSKFTRNEAFSRAGYILLFITVLSFLIHENLRGLYNYMNVQEGVSYLPAARIRRMNTLFLLFFTGLSAAMMILLPGSFIRSIGNTILGLIKNLISRLLQIIFGSSSTGGEGVIAEHDINYSQATDANTASELIKAILEVIQQVAKLAAILFLFYLLYCVVIAVYRYFSSPKDVAEEDVHEYVEVETQREKLARDRRRKRAEGIDNTVEGKVRKRYKEAVIRSLREQAVSARWFRKQRKTLQDTLGKLTPEEIEAFAGIEPTEANMELHSLYEKARYGNDLKPVP